MKDDGKVAFFDALQRAFKEIGTGKPMEEVLCSLSGDRSAMQEVALQMRASEFKSGAKTIMREGNRCLDFGGGPEGQPATVSSA